MNLEAGRKAPTTAQELNVNSGQVKLGRIVQEANSSEMS